MEIAPWLRRMQQAVLLGCVALPGVALTQIVFESEEVAAEEVEEIRRYLVEMIIFEHTAGGSSGTEKFLPEVTPDEFPIPLPRLKPGELPETARIGPVLPPSFGDNRSIFEPEPPVATDDTTFIGDHTPEYRRWLEQQTLDELPSHILQTRLEVLDAEQHAMPETYQKLRSLGAYRPIMRAAWSQAVYEKDQTLPIDLRRLGNPPLRLDGIMTLYLSRYLHLVADLTIDAGETVLDDQGRDSPHYYGDNRTRNFFDEGYDIATAPVRYRIFEDRIFRNGETRYYDHPKFGIVARITRVEETEPEMDGDPETDEMFLLPAN